MSVPAVRVISIGALSAHPLWDERGDVRTGHATTTLITSGDAVIVVDPGLPGQILAARLGERSRVTPQDVTHVFITTFSVEHYRGLALFERARWLVHEPEQMAASAAFDQQRDHARETGDPEVMRIVESHRALLERCRPADDRIVPGVDLFPLPGVSPGACGLLVSRPTETILVCGDAVPTLEHLEQGKVLPTSTDIGQAQDSFREAVEIADLLVLGRDNVVYNPLRVGV